MSQLRIYGIARTRAFRAIWIAKELGLPFEHVPIEIGAAGARTPDYLAINPNGRLPAIDDGGFILWESLAITLYLAKKHSTGRLYPATIEGEAKAWQWSLWSVQVVDRGVNIWSLHALRLPSAERDGERLAEALKVLERPFKVLDGALAGGGYLLGGEFTVADLNVAASSVAQSTWIWRRCPVCKRGSRVASNGRRHKRRSRCGRRPMPAFRSR